MKANYFYILALLTGHAQSLRQHNSFPVELNDDVILLNMQSDKEVMTAAASPGLEIAEANFKNAKIELNESDQNF